MRRMRHSSVKICGAWGIFTPRRAESCRHVVSVHLDNIKDVYVSHGNRLRHF